MKGKQLLVRWIAFFLLSALILTSCVTVAPDDTVTTSNTEAVPDEPVTLRLVVEEQWQELSAAEVMIGNVIAEYEKDHPNVTIEVEEIPLEANGDDREMVLDRLRTEIMAGRGPDVYLLPTWLTGGALFPDVNLAMRNGLFADLSRYYDADKELNTAGLRTVVMDAGVVDGHRYTLPLRYDFPVAYIEKGRFEEAGLRTEVFSKGITDVLDTIVATGNPEIAAQAHFILGNNGFNFFPELIDYEQQKVLLDKEELTSVLESYAAFIIAQKDSMSWSDARVDDYVAGRYWAELGACMKVHSVQKALNNAAFSKILGIDLEMYPLTGADGKVIAEVSYFGAVDGNCKYPALAYDFLRRFLTEEAQWERNVTIDTEEMSADGYCVRTEGSAAPYFDKVWSRVANHLVSMTVYDDDGNAHKISDEFLKERKNWLRELELTDEDVPILQTEIAVARYPINDIEIRLTEVLISIWEGETDMDIAAFAGEIIDELYWHLMEG